MPSPAGLKRAFFRIFNFQNKLTPIRGKSKKKKQKAALKMLFFICIVIKSIWILVMILKY